MRRKCVRLLKQKDLVWPNACNLNLWIAGSNPVLMTHLRVRDDVRPQEVVTQCT